ncbi:MULTISPECIES: TonB-dependent receptor [unclassified Stenotrophomonas]|uniref:TonB-dependent receptor plug domain-containing protein n=1 Tax=unclassified Stenotrophomonas TaxID=196198 RepID=UPI000D15F7B2|nr:MULTISPECIES: TonB-dependent receptor [unclassified Stenotrophomonas]PTA73650.1 TonB-dependent receptor [Stenotrophomonas sp. Nf1]PTA82755.1 TonB-dependent receptor [Stenotrophomonas sp. Nf4]
MRAVPGTLQAGLRRSLLCIVLALATSPAFATETAGTLDIDVAAGPLAPALQQWARQSGIALLFDARELDGLRSSGSHGRRDVAAALKELVAGLPVTILRTPSGGFVVRRTRATVPAPAEVATRPTLAAPRKAPDAPPQVELAPIHVTGSRLPRTSVQTTLPVTIIDRDDILRSGYGSLFDLLRHLPGMNGHPAMSTSRSGDSQYLPVGAATTTSLDGMGPRATLFLVNGRRLPRYPMVSLEQGGLTDLGGIPLSFVERIELVRGGASAIYGADAMSGVVNIILRDQAEGPEATLQTGLSSRGDAGQYRVQAATGGVRDGGDRWFAGVDLYRIEHVAGDRRDWHAETSQYLIGAFQGNRYWPARSCEAPLQRRDDGCWFDSARPRSIQPASDTASAYLRYRHERGDGRYAYAEARASHNRQRFDLGPTAVAIGLYGFTFNSVLREAGNVRPRVRATDADLAFGLGREQRGRSWDAGISAQRSDVTLATSGTVRTEPLLRAAEALDFLPGFTTLRTDAAQQLFPSIRNRGRTEQWQGWWGIQRELMPLPGGHAQLATGVDVRQERWTSHPDALLSKGDLALGLPQQQRRLSRRSGGAYAELGLPLAPTLRMDLAARADRDGGYSAFSPRAGLRWSPTAHWSFLLASGRGYRAPSLFEQRRPPGYFGSVELPASSALPECAQLAGGGRCSVTAEVVENDALKPERSRSHSLAASWTPTDTVSLSLTHNIVELRNEILALQPADAVWNSSTWELDEDGHLRSLRLSFDNIGRTTSRNWVMRGEYRIDAGGNGQWLFSLDALKQQALRRDRGQDAAVDLRGHVTPTTAAVLNVQWQNSNWDVALRGNQVGRTRAWLPGAECPDDQRELNHCMNPRQLRWNLHLARRLGPRIVAAVDVHNVLDAQPVNYLVGNGGQMPGLDDPLGRYILLTLQFR